jgi:hypothetical protein
MYARRSGIWKKISVNYDRKNLYRNTGVHQFRQFPAECHNYRAAHLSFPSFLLALSLPAAAVAALAGAGPVPCMPRNFRKNNSNGRV